MGSRERYFGMPENSLLRRGAAAVAAVTLALSLSACKTTNATGSNSGSEISTGVGNGDTSTGVNNGNEVAPGVNRGGLRPVEGSNTDPGRGLAYSDGDIKFCIPATDGTNREYLVKSPNSVDDVVGNTKIVRLNEPASECSSNTEIVTSGELGDPFGGWVEFTPDVYRSCISVYDNNDNKVDISVVSRVPTADGNAFLITKGC